MFSLEIQRLDMVPDFNELTVYKGGWHFFLKSECNKIICIIVEICAMKERP